MTEKWDVFQHLGGQIASPAPMQEETDPRKILLRQQEANNRRRKICLDSIGVFMQEATEFDMDKTISSQELYAVYKTWCEQEGVIAETMRTFCYRLKHGSYRVKATVLYQNGKQCRGFRGIRIKGNDTCDT